MTDLITRARAAQSTDPSPSRHALWGELIEALERAEAAIATYVARHDSGTHTAGDMQPLRQIANQIKENRNG
jgi:hypothetical protein